MSFTNQQLKEANKRLSPEVQDFVMDNETTDLIAEYLKKINLSEEQENSADSEVLYAMYGLQSLDQAIANIAELSGKQVSELRGLKSDLEENIFNKIKSLGESNLATNSVVENKPKINQSNVGQSFEQIILNQAMAMQPARPAGLAGGSMNYESGIMNGKSEPPNNLPTEKPVESRSNIGVPNYGGSDPYREPIG